MGDKRVMGYIDSGKKDGATVHIGGERYGDSGYFIQPTIFVDTRPDMKIVREEIFGPVVALIKFEDEDEAIRQANDTVYGLGASVFTQDINKALNTANRIQSGQVWVNSVNDGHFAVAFGGWKQSGNAKELGEDGLLP